MRVILLCILLCLKCDKTLYVICSKVERDDFVSAKVILERIVLSLRKAKPEWHTL